MGGLCADMVKGPVDAADLPQPLRDGITLHRRLDSFASRSTSYLAGKRLIDPRFGHWRGIMADVFFDHFLAIRWEELTGEPLGEFLPQVEGALLRRREILPREVLRVALLMVREWIPRYPTVRGTEEALRRLSQRVGRPNPMAEGVAELRRQYAGLDAECGRLIGELRTWREGR